MKNITKFIIVIILSSCVNGEKFTIEEEVLAETNDCLSSVIPEDFFITDTMLTEAGSMIFWQYNQDSSWLTYEEVNGTKTTLNSMYCGMMNYTYLLGTQRFDVYPNYAVFYHEWISGCCTPPSVIFLDNHTPKEINRISSWSIIGLKGDEDICIYFTDSTLNNAICLDLKLNKSTFISFPNNLLKSKQIPSGHQYPRDFFNEIEVNENKLKLVYQYKNDESETEWTKDSTIVNMENNANTR